MDVFDALADPVRRSLLGELAAGSCRVVDLAAARPISRPAVSKHLRLLLDAGTVRVTDHGRERLYALEPAGLAPVQAYVDGLLASALSLPISPITPGRLDALDTEVRRTTRERRRGTPRAGTSTEESA